MCATIAAVSASFCVPCVKTKRVERARNQSYLRHLVGHQGAGSLLSLLKAKGWANDLVSGLSESNTDWSNFVVDIECTEKGIVSHPIPPPKY